MLAKLINAAFRLPEVSVRYLHSILLERGPNEMTPEAITEEIKFRENAHAIGPESPLYSSDIVSSSVGIPPTGFEAYPPLVHSIQAGSQASFPLRLSHADSYVGEGVGERIALVGDAAHTVHPLAGQGLNMGLEDAQALAQTIGDALSLGSDIGMATLFISPSTRPSSHVVILFRHLHCTIALSRGALRAQPRYPLRDRQAGQGVCTDKSPSSLGALNRS